MSDKHEPSPLGERIRALRQIADVSARELDRLAGLKAEGHTSLIESGVVTNVRVDTVALIARVLGVSIDWLVTGEGKPPVERTVRAAVKEARDAKSADGTGPHKVAKAESTDALRAVPDPRRRSSG